MADEPQPGTLIGAANAVEAAWKRLLHRAIQAQTEYSVTERDLWADAMNAAMEGYQAAGRMYRSFEERATLLARLYDEQTEEIDLRYPSRRGDLH